MNKYFSAIMLCFVLIGYPTSSAFALEDLVASYPEVIINNIHFKTSIIVKFNKQSNGRYLIPGLISSEIHNIHKVLSDIARSGIPKSSCGKKYYPKNFRTVVEGDNLVHKFNIQFVKLWCDKILGEKTLFTKTAHVTTTITPTSSDYGVSFVGQRKIKGRESDALSKIPILGRVFGIVSKPLNALINALISLGGGGKVPKMKYIFGKREYVILRFITNLGYKPVSPFFRDEGGKKFLRIKLKHDKTDYQEAEAEWIRDKLSQLLPQIFKNNLDMNM